MILTRDGKEITAIYRQDGSEVEEVKDANGRIIYLPTREITGMLPLSFSSRGKPLTDYLISGNTLQDGTPTPEAPVDVVGCGEKTAQLFDKNTAVYGKYLNEDGTVYPESIQKTAWLSDYIPVAAGLTYTLNRTGSRRGKFYKADKTPYQTETMDFSGLNSVNTFTIPETVAYIRFTIYKNVATPDVVMLNVGSTALPYEPYGYKLPLTVNGTEYPIYLGQAPTTRRIKKLVLTGNESWSLWSSGQPDVERYYYKWGKDTPSDYGLICTHLPFSQGDGNFEHIRLGGNIRDDMVIFISKTIAPTVADFKSYLAAQYNGGTPVTVWYVLATTETGVVNEPLMKIGDYADTITMAQAGVAIPTVSGANVLDMTSTVKHSKVYIKGKGIKQNGG